MEALTGVLQAVQNGAGKRRRGWPLFVIALPAAVAVWSGWVGLGGLCGFGLIHPLPGILDSAVINTAITLPVGVEAYGAYALGIWADVATPKRVRRFAFWSALGSLALGLLGQVVFHLLSAAGYARAPWPVVVFVSCIPVAALGFGMGLHQLLIHAAADEISDEAPAGAKAQPDSGPTLAELRQEITETVAERLALETARVQDPAAARHIETSLGALRGVPVPAQISRTAVLDGLARTIRAGIPALPEPPAAPQLPGQPEPAAVTVTPPPPVRPEPAAAPPKTRRKPEPAKAAAPSKGSQVATERKPGDPEISVILAASSAEQLATDTGISRWRAQQLFREGSYARQPQLQAVKRSGTA